jgi:hypothetical protein
VAEYRFDLQPLASASRGGYWTFEAVEGGWLVAQHVNERDGQLVVDELRVIPEPRSEAELTWLSDSLEKPTYWTSAFGQPDYAGVEPQAPPGGLVARKVRPAIRTGQAIARAREIGTWDRSRPYPPRFSEEVLEAPHRVGSRGRDDLFFAKAARIAVAAHDRGERAPVQVLAEYLGDGWSRTGARDLLTRARQRGLLTHPPRGRPVGRLTARAEELLRDADGPPVDDGPPRT